MIKLRLYDLAEKLTSQVVGPIYRRLGKNLALSGLKLQSNLTSDDGLVPSLRCKSHQQTYPNLQKAHFIAPNSAIVGNVQLGEKASIWYGATIRGEHQNITIGNESVIQDLAQIYPTQKPVVIGDNVVVGSNTTLQSCKLENNSFVGSGATVSEGSVVESFGVVTAGAVLAPNTTVKSNQIWSGCPAVYLRDITPEEKQTLSESHQELVYLSKIHAEESEKSFREIINDLDEKNNELYEDSEQQALKKMKELGFPMEFDDEDYIEQRVFLKKADGPKESEFWKKQYDQYEQDLHHFPDSFKAFQENYDKYDEIKQFFEQNPNVEAQSYNTTDFEYPSEKNNSWSRKF